MTAIYARQSIDKKDSLSIEAQTEYCKKFAGEDVKVFKDKGFSGKNTNRPAFTELIKAVEAGQIEKIFVYRLDRFSRSIADFSRLWELLEKHNVQFNSVTENFDTSSPIGRAMLNIVLVFAQLERETTAERVRDNYIHRFKLGAWGGGPAPYGYDLTKITVDGVKSSSLIKNEKSEIVEWIFQQYAKPETTLRSIAKKLTERSISGPKREIWDNVTLSRILHSPLYVKADKDVYLYYLSKHLQIQQPIEAFDGSHGCNIIGKRDRSKNKYNSLENQYLTVANHLGFINSELWLKVQEKLDSNKQIPNKNAGKHSWLTGLLKCAKCGYALKINYIKSENKYYLVCSGKSNFSICDCRISVDVRELEKYIEKEIVSMLHSTPPQDYIPKSVEISSEVLEIEKKIERLVAALSESGEIAISYLNKEIERLHLQKEALLKNDNPKPERRKEIDFAALSFDEKKIVAKEFIEKILISGNEVNIVWRI